MSLQFVRDVHPQEVKSLDNTLHQLQPTRMLYLNIYLFAFTSSTVSSFATSLFSVDYYSIFFLAAYNENTFNCYFRRWTGVQPAKHGQASCYLAKPEGRATLELSSLSWISPCRRLSTWPKLKRVDQPWPTLISCPSFSSVRSSCSIYSWPSLWTTSITSPATHLYSGRTTWTSLSGSGPSTIRARRKDSVLLFLNVQFCRLLLCRGRIHYTEMYDMLKNMDPPLGFGSKCPDRLAYKKLIRMNMPLDQEGKVNFTTTLFALIRENLNIKMRSAEEMDQADVELRETILKVWPFTAKDKIELLVPTTRGLGAFFVGKNDFAIWFLEIGKGKLTVGKIYGGLLILENWKQSKFGNSPMRKVKPSYYIRQVVGKKRSFSSFQNGGFGDILNRTAGDRCKKEPRESNSSFEQGWWSSAQEEHE